MAYITTENPEHGVSIITPCHNDGRFLQEAIRSVFAQETALPFEIIIVDDGSTEQQTREVIKSICERYPNVRSLRLAKNSGASHARNIGLQAGKYDYVLPLDADNKLSTNPRLISNQRGYMDRAVSILSKNPDVVLVQCAAERFDGRSGVLPVLSFNEKRHLYARSFDTRAIYRRAEALAIKGYNEDLTHNEDWDFSVAMLNNRHVQGRMADIAYIEDPVFMYRVRTDGTNICARSGLPVVERYKRVIERSPEIYAKHFPHIAMEDMADAMVRKKRWHNIGHNLGLLFRASTWGNIPGKLTPRFNAKSGFVAEVPNVDNAPPDKFDL